MATSGWPAFRIFHQRIMLKFIVLTILRDRVIPKLHFDGYSTNMKCAVYFRHIEIKLSQKTCPTRYFLFSCVNAIFTPPRLISVCCVTPNNSSSTVNPQVEIGGGGAAPLQLLVGWPERDRERI